MTTKLTVGNLSKRYWPLGSVDLTAIDIVEYELIELTGNQPGRLCEPDAVAWTSNDAFATADEG